MKKILGICLLLFILYLSPLTAFISTTFAKGIAATKHNLSVSGPGPIKALEETQICIFCHTPHNANPANPLWSHQISDVKNYETYWSPTMEAYSSRTEAPQPDGASKLCLSCHDGTIAIGAIKGRPTPIQIEAEIQKMPPSAKGYIGLDLSGSHPISFAVTEKSVQARNLKGKSRLHDLTKMRSDTDGVRLDGKDKMQCTSCHNPHEDENFSTSRVHFWRKPTWSGVCKVCHNL